MTCDHEAYINPFPAASIYCTEGIDVLAVLQLIERLAYAKNDDVVGVIEHYLDRNMYISGARRFGRGDFASNSY